jgi:hypothetical protein
MAKEAIASFPVPQEVVIMGKKKKRRWLSRV